MQGEGCGQGRMPIYVGLYSVSHIWPAPNAQPYMTLPVVGCG